MAKAKVLKVTTNNMVNEIMTTAGVNKENAQNIFNLFTKNWNLNRIDFLKAIETGIVVKKTATRRKPAKKAVKKATPAKKVAVVAKVKKKAKKVTTKSAKKIKKAKKIVTPKVETSSTTSATA